ncbi:transmembrane 4 L6 family member 1-like [Callorhinus ursinus]|uniref:transmembrane 4 L6 family member 1-like n=1 Tax=Callorhinus ursinus TaxID=34884 RepID=UPI003CD012DB
MAIITNLLLYFPSGQVLEPAKITDLIWLLYSFLGAGLLDTEKDGMSGAMAAGHLLPDTSLVNRTGRQLEGYSRQCCFADETQKQGHMLFPVLLTMQGTMGALYCVVISSVGLLSSPFCEIGGGNYTYLFSSNTLEDDYLFNQPTWATCQEPEHIVLWNVVLLSIFPGIGVVEAVLCVSQVASELCDIFCGTRVRKGQEQMVITVLLVGGNRGSELAAQDAADMRPKAELPSLSPGVPSMESCCW